MYFSITNNAAGLISAINDFNAEYHRDYSRVRAAAADYLSQAPSTDAARMLASGLLQALKSWGAGKRGAPDCVSVDVAANCLRDANLVQQLQALADAFAYMSLDRGIRQFSAGAPFSSVESFDASLLDSLNKLADGLLVGNTNVTYPMKALLLLTGLMPAYDSQVKGGLAAAGIAGINKTRYVLPRVREVTHPDALKICVMPFYLADCVARSSALLEDAVAGSRYPELSGQYGRLFDILLFMQAGATADTALIRFSAPTSGQRWYEV